jgi:serine/threonine-protein kinase
LAATAFHLLTGVPPFQNSNPAVVISQHLSASPPAIGDRRPELSALDPVLAKALSKDPKDRFERCADFARALVHRLDAAPTGDVGTTFAPSATAPKRSLLRAGVIVPAILAVLLVVAVTVALMEFRRADRPEAASPTTKSPALATPTFTALPPPPEPVQPPVAVIGARCAQVGTTATTADGSTAYCSTLQTTGASIWSLNQGDVASPTVTTEPTESPAPIEEESPVRVCMQQTGQTWLRCREDIRRSNLGLP